MMAFLVLSGVLFAKRLTPLIEKQSIRNTALFMLLVSTTCVVGGASFAEWGAILSLAGAVIGGAGIAITLILWSELYSCLNPLRVALYYSASIVASGAHRIHNERVPLPVVCDIPVYIAHRNNRKRRSSLSVYS